MSEPSWSAAAAAAASRGSGPRRTALIPPRPSIGHPACQAVVRVAAVALVTALVTNAYLPFHDAYRRGCVAGRGGTFATKSDSPRECTRRVGGVARVRDGERRGRARAQGHVRVVRAGERRAAKARAERASPPPPPTRAARARRRDAARRARPWRSSPPRTRAPSLVAFAAGRDIERDILRALRRQGGAPRGVLAEMDESVVRMCLGGDDAFALDDGALFDCAALGACASARCVGPRREVGSSPWRSPERDRVAEGTAHASLLRAALIAAVFLAANAARATAVEGAAASTTSRCRAPGVPEHPDEDQGLVRAQAAPKGSVVARASTSGNARERARSCARARQRAPGRGVVRAAVAREVQIDGAQVAPPAEQHVEVAH